MKTTRVQIPSVQLVVQSELDGHRRIQTFYLQLKHKGIYQARMKFKGNLLPVADLNSLQSLERQLNQNSSKVKDAIVSNYICRVEKCCFVIV